MDWNGLNMSGGLVQLIAQDQYLMGGHYVDKCHEHCHFNGKTMECTMEQRKNQLREIWKKQRSPPDADGGDLLGLLPKDMIEYLCDMLEKKEYTTAKFWVDYMETYK